MQNLEVKQQSTQNMLEWLEREVATQQAKVEQSERELAAYRDRENAKALDDYAARHVASTSALLNVGMTTESSGAFVMPCA